MTRVLSLPELAARRTQLALARETARTAAATARRLLRELVEGTSEETDERQLALPVALEPQAPAAGPVRWRVDAAVSYPAISLLVEPPPTPEQLGLSALAVSLLEEMRAEPDSDNQIVRLAELLESGVDESHALEAIAELVAVGALVEPDVHHQGDHEWHLCSDPMIWPDPVETMERLVRELPILDTEVFSAADMGRAACIPRLHVEACLSALESIGALIRVGEGWQRVRRIERLEQSILDAVKYGHAQCRHHLERMFSVPDELIRWAMAEMWVDGVNLFGHTPGKPQTVETVYEMLRATADGRAVSLENIAGANSLPPWLVLEALELLESRGEASSGVSNGEVVWTVNRPPPKPKAEKKQAPKKAKKTSEVRA